MTPPEQSSHESAVRYAQIPCLHGCYFIGSDGSILKIKELSPGLNRKRTHSYYIMNMFDEDGRKYYATVHSLVAHAFIGPRPKGMFIDHIDGNTFNNDISNLEYVTPAENVRRAFASGRRKIDHALMKRMTDAKRGQRGNRRRFSDEEAYKIIEQYKSGQYSMKTLGAEHDCSGSMVHRIVWGDSVYRELHRVKSPSALKKVRTPGID